MTDHLQRSYYHHKYPLFANLYPPGGYKIIPNIKLF